MIRKSWLLPPFYVVLSTLKAVAACKIANSEGFPASFRSARRYAEEDVKTSRGSTGLSARGLSIRTRFKTVVPLCTPVTRLSVVEAYP